MMDLTTIAERMKAAAVEAGDVEQAGPEVVYLDDAIRIAQEVSQAAAAAAVGMMMRQRRIECASHALAGALANPNHGDIPMGPLAKMALISTDLMIRMAEAVPDTSLAGGRDDDPETEQ